METIYKWSITLLFIIEEFIIFSICRFYVTCTHSIKETFPRTTHPSNCLTPQCSTDCTHFLPLSFNFSIIITQTCFNTTFFKSGARLIPPSRFPYDIRLIPLRNSLKTYFLFIINTVHLNECTCGSTRTRCHRGRRHCKFNLYLSSLYF